MQIDYDIFLERIKSEERKLEHFKEFVLSQIEDEQLKKTIEDGYITITFSGS